MKKVWLMVGLTAVLVAVLFVLRPQKRIANSGSQGLSPRLTQPATSGAPASATSSAMPDKPLLGEAILRGYGAASLPPENDLTLLSRLMDNFMLLVKSSADRPLSANEDWAAALRGHNPSRERFLPDQHAALNAQGQLVDRWGTPLFFHALGGRRFEVRSAGPDRALWTADDLHRNSDGSFRRGAELNAASLVDLSTRR